MSAVTSAMRRWCYPAVSTMRRNREAHKPMEATMRKVVTLVLACLLVFSFAAPALPKVVSKQQATFIGIPDEFKEAGMFFVKLVDRKGKTIVNLGAGGNMGDAVFKCLDVPDDKTLVKVSGVLEKFNDGSSGMDEKTLTCERVGQDAQIGQVATAQNIESPKSLSSDQEQQKERYALNFHTVQEREQYCRRVIDGLEERKRYIAFLQKNSSRITDIIKRSYVPDYPAKEKFPPIGKALDNFFSNSSWEFTIDDLPGMPIWNVIFKGVSTLNNGQKARFVFTFSRAYDENQCVVDQNDLDREELSWIGSLSVNGQLADQRELGNVFASIFLN